MIVEARQPNKPVLDMSLQEALQLQVDLAAMIREAVIHHRHGHLEMAAYFRRGGPDTVGAVRLYIDAAR